MLGVDEGYKMRTSFKTFASKNITIMPNLWVTINLFKNNMFQL